MQLSPLLDELIQALKCLPGVGPKTAQRMAFQLLERQRDDGLKLSQALSSAMEHIGHCSECRTFSEVETCKLCLSEARKESGQLCVVESPSDVMAIEQTGHFSGQYFVLMGHLSPIDGIGPDDLGLDILERRLEKNQVSELILATNPTVEGETTAHFIADIAKRYQVAVSRIAHGVPVGGELEYVDGTTLSHALTDRKSF